MNALQRLNKARQSVWLDYIRRDLLTNGDLTRLIDDGIRGVTSNPSIFEKAIAGSHDYDAALTAALDTDPHSEPATLFEQLAIDDIQQAADALRPLYASSDAADGYVSLEVSPTLANDTAGTVIDARRLWKAVDRPNLMIKVPATVAGVAAVEILIGDSINVNATLIFSLDHYEAVAQAYLRGLARVDDPSRVASVASFFVSRVDTAVDRVLEENGSDKALALRGRIAVANAKLAYRRYRELFEGDGFAELRARGAQPQRVLWASTGAKNPAYSDVVYIEELVGPNTVNTVPPATLDAFRDHGKVRGEALLEDVAEAANTIGQLAELGIDLDEINDGLQQQGLAAFADSYHQLLHSLDEKARKLRAGIPNSQHLALGDHAEVVAQRVERWADAQFVRRLWSKDYTLWTDEPEPDIMDRLGWLTLPERMHETLDTLTEFSEKVVADGFRRVVLLGMGGSSLAPEVFQRTFGSRPGFPELIVLDSTHPDAVRAVEDRIDLATTLFIVASKSGTTLEPLSFFRYFWQRVGEISATPGSHFIAISDPDSSLVELARERGFRRVFEATPDVGGRYSGLTHFGLVPAALIGVDVHRVLDRGWRMAEGSAFCVPEVDNAALELGAALGMLAKRGMDKATFLASPSLTAFPSWLEQLVAESTGKNDTGILPVADEAVGTPSSYSDDRFFIYLSYAGDTDVKQAHAVAELEAAGHPVARIRLAEKEDIGAEMFRAEFAVAAAGSALGIHPFNQPDVQVAKEMARSAMAGTLDGEAAAEVRIDDSRHLADSLQAWLDSTSPGDYVALQAYVAPTASTDASLERIRVGLRDRLKVATTLGYGPRFLHSTGQFHKGGPNTGLFLQLIDEPVADVAVPETDYGFGNLIAAQALGDYQALTARGRRVLRVNLGDDAAAGLALLEEALRG